MRERGSASLVVMAALAFAAIFSLFAADASRASAARGRAQTAADAAALAAAQELILSSGREIADVAQEYASRHGADVVACRCARGSDDVVVTVELQVTVPFLAQTRDIRASARARVTAPPGAEGLRPFFIARLGCLFDRVPGLWIVSGFRTHAEQAALHQQKPDLAAPAGQSNHEVGLAADLGFPSEDATRVAHTAAPGCGLSFPVPYEPWHVEPAGLS